MVVTIDVLPFKSNFPRHYSKDLVAYDLPNAGLTCLRRINYQMIDWDNDLNNEYAESKKFILKIFNIYIVWRE